MTLLCPNCNSYDLDTDSSRGYTACTECGHVLEENTVISEVAFQETGNGGAQLVGQTIAEDEHEKAYIPGVKYGVKVSQSKKTESYAEQEIYNIGQKIGVTTKTITQSVSLFKLAIKNGLSRGRKLLHLVVACMYLTCRNNHEPHLLIDFSDIVQVNVFALGRVYLTTARKLHFTLPVLDPAIYIYKFTHNLDFGEHTQEVTDCAIRLVKRMTRDWISLGRRPSGVSGAALLLAGRLYGFNLDVEDIVRVAKIGSSTIRKRLTEFRSTASSQLTINQFLQIDLTTEANPPAYKNKFIRFEQNGQLSQLESEFEQLTSSIHSKVVRPEPGSRSRRDPNSSDVDVDELAISSKFINCEDPNQVAVNLIGGIEAAGDVSNVSGDDVITDESLLGPTDEMLGLVPTTDLCPATVPTKEEATGELDISCIDDDEIDKMIMSPEEVEIKTRIWMEKNGEHMEIVKEQEQQKEVERSNRKRKTSNRKKQQSLKQYYSNSSSTTEALEKLFNREKLSNKINYDALKRITEQEVTPICSSSSSSTSKSLPIFNRSKKRLSGLTSSKVPRLSAISETSVCEKSPEVKKDDEKEDSFFKIPELPEKLRRDDEVEEESEDDSDDSDDDDEDTSQNDLADEDDYEEDEEEDEDVGYLTYDE